MKYRFTFKAVNNKVFTYDWESEQPTIIAIKEFIKERSEEMPEYIDFTKDSKIILLAKDKIVSIEVEIIKNIEEIIANSIPEEI